VTGIDASRARLARQPLLAHALVERSTRRLAFFGRGILGVEFDA